MVSLFVGTWAYILSVVGVDVLVKPPATVVQWALVPALILVVAAGFVQFGVRCPSCGYRLGRQSRLVVPEQCRSCGVPLRRPEA